MTQPFRIATRQSPLALQQSYFVRDQLLQFYPDLKIELVPMVTSGDRFLQTALNEKGGKGLFVKELEVALLNQQADIAVHSMKDVPVEFPDNLGIHAILKRESAHDVFIAHQKFLALPKAARIGTSSLRRTSQLLHRRPNLCIELLRGNVNSRLEKFKRGDFDGLILAHAGLIRLDLTEVITEILPFDFCLPAGGQGAIGIECRLDDEVTKKMLDCLHHQSTEICVKAERAMNQRLGGGCHTPVAAYAEIINDQIYLRGLVGSPDGSKIIRAEKKGALIDYQNIGFSVAEKLLQLGANKILCI